MTVVFLDLDGTLTDAGPGILNCVTYALEKMQMPPFEGNGSWIVGPPLWDTFETLGVAKDDLDHAVALYRERYIDIGWFENSLYEGILGQLSALKDDGYTLCIATSKAHSYAKKITAHFGISEYMTHEFGSELDGTRSDKTSLLAHGLGVAGAFAENSLMVGDRSYDIIGAKNNDIKVIGVSYGYGIDTELAEAGADLIISNVTELSTAVRALLPLKDT
jgi:phosphoglycolate phosphatase